MFAGANLLVLDKTGRNLSKIKTIESLFDTIEFINLKGESLIIQDEYLVPSNPRVYYWSLAPSGDRLFMGTLEDIQVYDLE